MAVTNRSLDGLNGWQKIPLDTAVGNVARTEAESDFYNIGIGRLAHEEDFGVRSNLAYLCGSLDSVELGQSDVEAAVEETTGQFRWFESLLDELGFELWVGGPAQIRARRVRKQRNDRLDAEHIRKLVPNSYLDSFLLQLTIEPFGFSIAVHQPLLATLPGFCVHPVDLLYAGVIIATYNEHLGSFPPEPLVVATTKSTQVEGSRCPS